MMTFKQDVSHKLRVLSIPPSRRRLATCRYFGIGRASFYRWKAAFDRYGEAGLENRSCAPNNPANQKPAEIVEKVLHLRTKYHLGPMRIAWYMSRHHGIMIRNRPLKVYERHD